MPCKSGRAGIAGSVIRQAGQYCVNVYEHDFEALSGAGRLEQIDREFYGSEE